MLSITYNVKIITPVIMGGADSKQLDQIRPTEIKGMMRYWFRSIIGSTLKDDIEELQRIENMFFGSTDIRSPFKLIVNPINLNIGEFKRESSKYLGFSFNFKKQYKNETVKVILPESSFEVNFLFFQVLS